ncbi:hypothetical protein ACJX0J_025219, partial [Zea mays]
RRYVSFFSPKVGHISHNGVQFTRILLVLHIKPLTYGASYFLRVELKIKGVCLARGNHQSLINKTARRKDDNTLG